MTTSAGNPPPDGPVHPPMSTHSPTPVVLDARVVCGSGGGPDKTILHSPPFLARMGYRMLCAYLRHPDDAGYARIEAKAAAEGVELISIDDRGALDWRVIPRMLEVCRREKVAIWHGHDYKTNILGLILERFHPMRLVTTAHGWVEYTSRTPLYFELDRWSLRAYERVLCVSDDLHRDSLKRGIARKRCELLENGIDTDDWKRTRSPLDARTKLSIPPARLLIGAVGRLSPEKGFDRLIAVVADLIAEGLPVDLTIYGEGPQKDALQTLIDERGIGDRVRLGGYCGDLKPQYEAMDIYALSSSREGLPNVVLEAMAMGVPVAATRINGIPRLITDGVDGVLCEPGSADSLRDALRTLITQPELRARLSANARSTVEKRFSFEKRMRRMADIYDEMLARKPQ